MCHEAGGMLQRGMYFRYMRAFSIFLMSLRHGAPYSDRLENDGRVLVYEGHDQPRTSKSPNPKMLDQPLATGTGRPTQNGLFFKAAKDTALGLKQPELVKVYEKIKNGIWVFNGVFRLVDAWTESVPKRKVFKFKLELTDEGNGEVTVSDQEFPHSRMIPSAVKQEVWKRDRGQCILCGSKTNLHFDHDLPFSLGGSSILSKNIRLLCAGHNLAKGAKIQ